MRDYFALLKSSPLFDGIQEENLTGMLQCLNARSIPYRKDEILLLAGQPIASAGLVLSGRVQIIKEDYSGNRTILTEVSPGYLFAEAFACAQSSHLPITVISVSECQILWLDVQRVVSVCSSACQFHTRLIENLLAILASNNILLNQKIDHLSKRTTREKLLSYLSDQAIRQGLDEFEIPFSRQELADYLCVERSAMSAELSRMQNDGLLCFKSRRFRLLNQPFNDS
ncbi:MAG: Crp/Fnr family transcriptional regulator [Coriobacteriaceae bacterium]|nr:Crp/Fnr family transcriptional regulator [Coriobacteriaceae bacterium]